MIVATSLLDEKTFTNRVIAELYAQRWQVELHYRQIKTNLSLDVLRGLSPRMVERGLWMHAIAYNLIRALLSKPHHSYRTHRAVKFQRRDRCRPRLDRRVFPAQNTPPRTPELLARIAADRMPIT